MISYKFASETLDFTLDWTDWLEYDRITNATWTVPTGITKSSDSFTNNKTTIWLSGGTAGESYELSVLVTTIFGRSASRTLIIRIHPANILTPEEAANVLKCEIDDPTLLLLLPAIDAYIFRATGRKWEEDTVICEEAKSAARILLTQWHENPGMNSSEQAVLSGGLTACLTQLEAMAQYYFTFEGLDGAGSIHMHHIHEGDTVVKVTGKVGVSGDQAAKFESVITVDHAIQQISSDDLADKWFTAYIVPPNEI